MCASNSQDSESIQKKHRGVHKINVHPLFAFEHSNNARDVNICVEMCCILKPVKKD